MKKIHQHWQRLLSGCLCGIMAASITTMSLSYAATQNQTIDELAQDAGLIATAEAATPDYATELAKFPKSYQSKLKALHEKYPNWVFVAEYLDRDWQTVVDAENAPKVSTVTGASTWLRSQQSGDYDPSTDTYTSRDASSSGTYSANDLAVSYYLDPRNFLDEKNIFQFEALSYNSSFHTLSGIKAIISGSWMDTSKITYLNASGATKTIDQTYAEVILQAGKDNRTSPYFLAAKILNEVGHSSPSSSANGKHSTYPGIYNFYCIGAYNGTNPIASGLSYAAGSGSYQRPWNTPVKAINGGAEWIANGYINNSAGAQDTLYYQRFDVVKEDTNPFTHQYATNISYATSQASMTYKGYQSIGMLNKANIFYIPVYDNMPGEDAQSSKVTISTTPTTQTGTISGSDVSLRAEPTPSATRLDTLSKGASVTILEKVRSTTDSYSYFTSNPYWYKVKAGSTTGYVSASYVTISNNTITLKPGATYQLGATLSNKNTGEVCLMSSRDAVATVSASGKITAKASGTCKIIAFTSGGGFDLVTLKVSSSATNSTSSASAIPTADQAGKGTSSSTEGDTSSGGNTCTISGSSVNIRSGAGTSYSVVGTYDKGTKVSVTGVSTDGKWCKTAKGWVSADYVTPYKTGSVSGTTSLTVRKTAGTSGTKVTTIKSGTSLKLYASKSVSGTTWYLTNRGGWVSGKYVKLAGSSSGSSGGSSSSSVTYLTTKISGSDVNIRSGAGTSYSVVGTYNKGTTINITAVSGNWVKTSKGFVSGDYVTASSTGKVSGTTSLTVRKTAGTSGTKVTTLSSGTSLKLYAKTTVSGTTWYLTNKGGWVSSKYVKVSSSSSSGSSSSSTSVSVKISGNDVNIRSGAGTSYSVVGSYSKGTAITVTAVSGNWVKTSKGWVSADYVSAPTGTVSGTTSLTVRKTAGTSGTKVTTVKSGTKLKLYATKSVSGTTWYLTNKGGWVSGKYVKR